MPKIRDLNPLPGTPDGNEAIWADKNNSDFFLTTQQVLDFVASNISTAQLNELLKAQVAIRVENNGDVSNTPGRLSISVLNPEQGRYELTCPTGWVWHTAVGSGRSSSSVRTVNITGFGSDTVNATVFNESGTPRSYAFNVVGLLVPD